MPNQKHERSQIESPEERDQSFIGQPDDKRLIIQMHKPMWMQLRRIAFDENTSMAELCRQGVELLLAKYSSSKK